MIRKKTQTSIHSGSKAEDQIWAGAAQEWWAQPCSSLRRAALKGKRAITEAEKWDPASSAHAHAASTAYPLVILYLYNNAAL